MRISICRSGAFLDSFLEVAIMARFTPQYVEEHLANVHTYESFGRAIAERLARTAAGKLADDSPDVVRFDAPVEVSPAIARGCLRVCILGICFHINL
jgi:hypothetical protein